MTALALDIERPPILGAGPRRRTLDDVVAAAWRELAGDRGVACPVCSGRMQPRYGAGAAVVGGRCTDCGSALG